MTSAMLDTAKQYLVNILDALAPQLAAGTPSSSLNRAALRLSDE